MRPLRRSLAAILLSFLLIVVGSGDLKLSALELAAIPYRYQIVSWEITHLPDKWFHKLASYLPWNSTSEEDQLENVQEFFQLSREITALEQQLFMGIVVADNTGSVQEPDLTRDLEEAKDRRSDLRPAVEETLESYISAVISEEGLDSRIGLILPPVDVALESPPQMLVISQRHVISPQRHILLRADMPVSDREALEQTILELEDMSALVVGLGGVATYPSIVNQRSSLRGTAIIAAHEWLHTYWFFRPLGWNYQNSPEMTTLNETAASLIGREMGLRAYAAITGAPLEYLEPSAPLETADGDLPVAEEEESFDFRREMHTTRLRVDEMLAGRHIEAAESYMEARRHLFVEEGFPIRKLNQAYFAFYGTYADNPASVSPIGQEVQALSDKSNSLGDFVRQMAEFGSYQEFKEHLASSEKAPLRTSYITGAASSQTLGELLNNSPEARHSRECGNLAPL